MKKNYRFIKNQRNDFGLVLCGGGAKGAYQIGVWSFLLETGLIRHIGAVSGASVGALNALLIAQGDIGRATQTWLSATPDDMLQQAKLAQLIRNSIDRWDVFADNNMPVYAALSCISPGYRGITPVYVRLNGLSRDTIIRTVLASSAIPALTKPTCIDGELYMDGGVADNIPVRPLIHEGFRNILIVHLENNTRMERHLFRRSVDGTDTDGISFYHIYPSRKMYPQDFFALHQKHSAELMACGYHDAICMSLHYPVILQSA